MDSEMGSLENSSSEEKALLCAKAALDKFGENVRVLDLKGQSSFTSYFVVCSGRSTKQVQAISHAIDEAAGWISARCIEGQAEGRWILMDLGDVVVHIFLEELREYYDIESLWTQSRRVPIPAEYLGTGATRLE